LLRLWGHRPHTATTGADAVSVAATEQPDVILLDLVLPDMPGCDLVKRIRDLAMYRRPLVIAVTSSLRDLERRQAYEAGVDLHLVKPVDPFVLQAVLSRFGRLVAPL
jgi:CheY-like chemotaxis protein